MEKEPAKNMFQFFPVFLLVLMSCNKTTVTDSKPTETNVITDTTIVKEEVFFEEEPFADYYLVIVESGKDYASLHQLMFEIHHQFGIEIDTLGRYYNVEKQQIVLPEDDEAEIYQGEYYFPRRFVSETLSIENSSFYKKDELEPLEYPTEMILVAGMYDNKSKADSLQTILKSVYSKTIVQKSKIYIGCMH